MKMIMKINYSEILKKNMINVFKDVLLEIEKNGLQEGHHLYINFNTNNAKVEIPQWLKEKYPKEISIVIQHEYWNLKIKKKSFSICLSFNNEKIDLNIPFDSIISFADPYANFGLKLKQKADTNNKHSKTKVKRKKVDNIIDFKEYKKN